MHFKLLSLKTYLKLSFYYIHTEKSMPFHKVFYSYPTINFYDWNPWYAPKQQWKVAWMPTSGAWPCCPERQQFCCSEKKELCQVLPHCSPALLMQAVKVKQKKSENRFIIKERGKKMFLSSCSFSWWMDPSLPFFLQWRLCWAVLWPQAWAAPLATAHRANKSHGAVLSINVFALNGFTPDTLCKCPIHGRCVQQQ